MRAEELANLTPEELDAKGNEHFLKAESFNPQQLNAAEEKLAHLLEAQFYLTAAARKRADEAAGRERQRNEEIATRDFWMEVGVMVLIGIEIVLSFIFGVIAIREGNEQAAILDKVKKSTADTAMAMQAAKDSLQTLADDQAESLDRLREMNDNLQASLKLTGSMATSTQKQVEILEEQQAEHQAMLARKPNLILYVAGAPVAAANAIKPRSETDTSIEYDFRLANEGSATASKVQLRVIVLSKDISLQSSIPPAPTNEPPDTPFRTTLIAFEFIRKKVGVPWTMTFLYPKGQGPFRVIFNVDADEIETGTPLGDVTIQPRGAPAPPSTN